MRESEELSTLPFTERWPASNEHRAIPNAKNLTGEIEQLKRTTVDDPFQPSRIRGAQPPSAVVDSLPASVNIALILHALVLAKDLQIMINR
jgi:hypothetical protein